MQAGTQGLTLPEPTGGMLASVNEWRASQHWPLCTDMLPVALPECEDVGYIPGDTRALWQMGFLQLLKKVDTAVSVMRRALVPLVAQPEAWLGQLALAIEQLLLEDMHITYPLAMGQCFIRFDRELKAPTPQGLRTLWESLHFYATAQLAISDEGKAALKLRVQWAAGRLAERLVVKDSDDHVKKQDVVPYYLTLVDGLLFLGNIRLVQRLDALFSPLPSQLLNISVPVQKLWAQCASLCVHCP